MKTITLTITLEVPDGTPVTVGSGATSGLAPDASLMGGAGSGTVPARPSEAPRNDAEPPFPTEPPPDMTPAADAVFGDLVKNPENVLHDTPHVVAGPVAPPGGHHGLPWKYVPAGVSKKSGASYPGFWACAGDRDCKARP